VEQEARKEQTFGKIQCTKPKGSQVINNLDVKEQLHLRSERTPSRIFRKTIRLEIMK
jgi:hypothetical protein